MTNKKALIFAVILLAVSLWLTVSVIITMYGGAGFIGYFLYNTFYHTAFYVPLYLVFCAFFLLRKNFNKNDIVVLILTLIPFFTAGTALRIYLKAGNTYLEKMIAESFGPLSPLLLMLLVVIELILIMHAALFLKKHPDILENNNTDNFDSDLETVNNSGSLLNNNIINEDLNSEAEIEISTVNMSSGFSEDETELSGNNAAESENRNEYSSDQFSENLQKTQKPEKLIESEYKSLTLASVASLSGRKTKDNRDDLENYIDDSSEIDQNSFRNINNPSDYGYGIDDSNYAGRENIEDPDEAYNNQIITDEEIKEESSVDGIDFSEPAYFRQQKDSHYGDSGNISAADNTENNDSDILPASYTENGEINSNMHVSDESEVIEAVFAEENMEDDILSEDTVIAISENPDYEEYPEISNESEDQFEDFPDSIDENEDQFEDIPDLIDENENTIQDNINTDVNAEFSSNADYDPLTQYNTEISAEPDFTDNYSDNSASNFSDVNNPENRENDNFDTDEEDDDYIDEEDDGPVVQDNTAIVKQYFDSARFIKPPKKPGKYEIPVENVLDFYQEEAYDKIDARVQEEADVLKRTLAEFKIEAEVTGIRKGPVITMFEILPAPGVKLSRITNLADNIALRLAASRVRIVAPIPGKHAVGIEVPNRKRAIVSFRELIDVNYKQYKNYDLPVVLGKDITGEEQIVDLTKTPHLLIAGATGSGKSVCVNSLITSILYKRAPRDVKMILIDPKIVELKLYNGIPHLLTPVITDAKKAYQALQYCVFEMERRYTLLDALSCRDIKSFNKKIKSEKIATMPLPYIVVVVDEFADLMATTGKELESTLARLAAMSRAVGIHLVLATQRPSIDVITGLIKANIPSRIAFMVASKTDSRIIIDSMGAEMLLGKGDMLFTSAWNPYPVRIQGAFLSEGEVERVVDEVKEYGEPEYIDDEIFIDDDEDDYTSFEEENINDPLMNKALEIVTTAGKASASYLQRRLKIGYNRAARLVEEMERKGIVGPQNGSKPRDLLHIPDNFKD